MRPQLPKVTVRTPAADDIYNDMRFFVRNEAIFAAALSALALLIGAVMLPAPGVASASDAGSDPHELPATLKWSTPVVRLVFVRDANWTLERQKTASAGFHEWRRFTGKEGVPRIVVLSSPTAVGDVNIRFVPPGTLGGKSVGLTQWQHRRGTIAAASMLLSITSSPDDALRQQSTAAHELGHALGITRHSEQESDVMYFSSVGKSVGPADVELLRAAYAQ